MVRLKSDGDPRKTPGIATLLPNTEPNTQKIKDIKGLKFFDCMQILHFRPAHLHVSQCPRGKHFTLTIKKTISFKAIAS